MDDMESKIKRKKKDRLKKIFANVTKDKVDLVNGWLTRNFTKIRTHLMTTGRDIVENGEYEKFKQSENQLFW